MCACLCLCVNVCTIQHTSPWLEARASFFIALYITTLRTGSLIEPEASYLLGRLAMSYQDPLASFPSSSQLLGAFSHAWHFSHGCWGFELRSHTYRTWLWPAEPSSYHLHYILFLTSPRHFLCYCSPLHLHSFPIACLFSNSLPLFPQFQFVVCISFLHVPILIQNCHLLFIDSTA